MKKIILGMMFIISIIMLVACNNVTSIFKDEPEELSQSTNLKEDSSMYTNEPEEAARQYFEALQSGNYKQAYSMLSNVFIDAGLTFEQFKSEVELSNFDFEGFKPFITKSSRSPKEISEQSKDENIYRLNVNLTSEGETREDYKKYEPVISNWFDTEMWFREEDGEWKYFGLGFLKDIVWRTDVYAAGLKLMEAFRNKDEQQLYGMYANYYIDKGYTPLSVYNQSTDLVYYRISEINRVGKGDEAFKIVGRELSIPSERRKDLQSIPQDYLVVFGYTLHLQDGEWKYATTQFQSKDFPLNAIIDYYNGIEISSNNLPATEDTQNDNNYTDSVDNDYDYTHSIETEEITTDLKDGNFVRIQFELITDNEEAKNELVKRDFQVNNIVLKELAQKTSREVKDHDTLQINLKEKINEILQEGQIVDVYITEFILQDGGSVTQNAEGHHPYGKTDLQQATIDQLDDPLYYNQITPNELRERIDSGETVTVYFYSPTCPFCLQTTPMLIPLAEENGVNVKLFNLLEFDEWATYNIEAIPSLIHFETGQESARIVGQQPYEEFQSFLQDIY